MTHETMIVTVIVYTYNSSNYILETLDSIKKQTYKDLMLIITDDSSTDSTIEICKKWLDINGDRFIKTKIITSEKNTGISGNANRGWNACETEYAKDIAGDDLLLPNCIQDFVDFIHEHPDTIIVFSRVRPFRVCLNIKMWYKESTHDYSFFDLSLTEQYRSLIYKGNNLPAASCFYNIKKLREIHFEHDERIPLLEDYPKWIKLLQMGIKFVLLDKHTVGYRLNENSLSVGAYSPAFLKSNILFYLYYYQDTISSEKECDEIFSLMCDHILHFYTKVTNSCEYKLGCLLLRPIRFIQTLYLYRKLNKRVH